MLAALPRCAAILFAMGLKPMRRVPRIVGRRVGMAIVIRTRARRIARLTAQPPVETGRVSGEKIPPTVLGIAAPPVGTGPATAPNLRRRAPRTVGRIVATGHVTEESRRKVAPKIVVTLPVTRSAVRVRRRVLRPRIVTQRVAMAAVPDRS